MFGIVHNGSFLNQNAIAQVSSHVGVPQMSRTPFAALWKMSAEYWLRPFEKRACER